jgi:hypothetical protein
MWRTVSLIVGGLCAIGVIVFVILILPPVQRWLVLAVIETPEMSRAEIGRARIWPGSARIEDIVIEKQGMRLTLGRAVVRGSIWKALLGGNVRLMHYELVGFVLAVDFWGRTNEPIGNTLIDAVFLLAPFAFELDQVDLSGMIDVRVALDRSFTARLVGQGGGFGASQTGRLHLNGEISGEDLIDKSVPFNLSIDFRRDDDFDRVESSLKGGLDGESQIAEFTLNLSLEDAVADADGSATVDFQQLVEMFTETGKRRLSSGHGELAFRLAANAAGESVIDGEIIATDLASAGSGYRIDRIEVPFRVTAKSNSSWSLRAPVEVVRPALSSDLLIELSAVVDSPHWRLGGTVSGDHILVDDLAPLGLLFTASSEPIDRVPAWGGIRGQIGLQFGRVGLQPGITMETLTAGIEFADLHAWIRDFETTVGGGSLTGDATLSYDPDSDEAYDLDGTWTGVGIQLGRPDSTAPNPLPIEGRFDLDLSVKSRASSLVLIGDRMSGLASIRGGPGIYRGLSDRAQVASSVAGFVGSLFRSEYLRTVSELSDELGEIRYDTIELEATKSVGEGIEIGRMLLQGPDVKLYGRGHLTGNRPAELMTSPMRFEFNLGVKGRLAELLGAVDLVSEAKQDWEGYIFIAEPLLIRGTPRNPDISELWDLLREAGTKTFR